MQALDAALLALEVEIFADDAVLTSHDEFLIRVLSHWSVDKRRESLSALIKCYGTPDFGTHIVHALARLICKDVELKFSRMFMRINHGRGEH